MNIGERDHDHNAQRSDGSVGQQHSIEASYVPRVHLHTQHREMEQEVQGPTMATVKRNYKELRKLGAVDFLGTTDPAEAETWLKRTERVLNMMCCTSEEKFDYAVSLLQSDAYDWWETILNSTVQPPILTWDDFLRDFRDKYMPEVYRDEKQREFLTLR